MEKRKKHFVALRAQEKRSKPPTKAQKRNTMSTYLKNIAGYKQNQLKGKIYDEIQDMFDKEMKRNRKRLRSKRVMIKRRQRLKRHIEIVKDDEVAIDAIPLVTNPLGDLKVMFEPDIKSDVWRNVQGYKVTVWKLFDNYGVHFVSTAGMKVNAAGLQLLEELLMSKRIKTILVPFDLSKDTKSYIKLRSLRSVHWDQQNMPIKTSEVEWFLVGKAIEHVHETSIWMIMEFTLPCKGMQLVLDDDLRKNRDDGERRLSNNNSSGGNPTPTSEPFTSELILEEIEAYLKDDSISPEIDHADCDPKGDICLIEKLLNNDPFQLPPMDLKQSEVPEQNPLIEEPPN
ncbi:hypothetical protein Tco_1457689 [Tanacetum coccineum]